jgi:hypothetical protein
MGGHCKYSLSYRGQGGPGVGKALVMMGGHCKYGLAYRGPGGEGDGKGSFPGDVLTSRG